MKKELVILLIVGFMVLFSLQQLDHHVDPWLNPVVKQGEFEATEWVKANTGVDSLFLADIFGGELLMGMTARTSLVGGDWAANINSPEQMTDLQTFYQTASADEAIVIWNKYNADYAWFPARQVYAGYGWIDFDENKMNAVRFEKVYENSGVRIYKLISNT